MSNKRIENLSASSTLLKSLLGLAALIVYMGTACVAIAVALGLGFISPREAGLGLSASICILVWFVAKRRKMVIHGVRQKNNVEGKIFFLEIVAILLIVSTVCGWFITAGGPVVPRITGVFVNAIFIGVILEIVKNAKLSRNVQASKE